jgi:hypothetical protein
LNWKFLTSKCEAKNALRGLRGLPLRVRVYGVIGFRVRGRWGLGIFPEKMLGLWEIRVWGRLLGGQRLIM